MPKQPYSLKHEADECTAIPGDQKGYQSFAALSQAECHLDPYIQHDGLKTTLSVI